MASFKKMITNWRVLVLVFFLVLALVAINPHIFGSEGVMIKSVMANSTALAEGLHTPATKLPPLSKERVLSVNNQKVVSAVQYYELEQSLSLGEVAIIKTNKGQYNFVPDTVDNTSVSLGLRVADAPWTNLRKGLDLAGGTRVLLHALGDVSQEDLDTTVASLQERLNVYGLSDVIVRQAKDLQGSDFILVEIAGVTEEEVKELLAKQGKFEATIANQTVFFGGKKDITHVCRSAQCSGIDPNAGCQRVGPGDYACRFFFSITLSPEAAQRQADLTNKLVVVNDGGGAYLSDDLVLILDDKQVDRLKIGAELKGQPTTGIQISGSGQGVTQQDAINDALQNMKKLQTIILTGSLPVKLEIVKMDTISPSLGEEFVRNILLTGLLVIIAVVAIVAIRYRNWRISLPMIFALFSEILLILGFAAFIGWNLDLAAIAGILVSIGTGVDDLIVITDESLSAKEMINWKQRIKNAMFIVFGSYFALVAGMLPLLWAGAGLLKGFAFTTIAGVSFGVFIARPAYAVLVEEILK